MIKHVKNSLIMSFLCCKHAKTCKKTYWLCHLCGINMVKRVENLLIMSFLCTRQTNRTGQCVIQVHLQAKVSTTHHASLDTEEIFVSCVTKDSYTYLDRLQSLSLVCPLVIPYTYYSKLFLERSVLYEPTCLQKDYVFLPGPIYLNKIEPVTRDHLS